MKQSPASVVNWGHLLLWTRLQGGEDEKTKQSEGSQRKNDRTVLVEALQRQNRPWLMSLYLQLASLGEYGHFLKPDALASKQPPTDAVLGKQRYIYFALLSCLLRCILERVKISTVHFYRSNHLQQTNSNWWEAQLETYSVDLSKGANEEDYNYTNHVVKTSWFDWCAKMTIILELQGSS